MKRNCILISNIKKGKQFSAKHLALFVVGGVLAASSVLMTVVAATSSVEVASLREKEKMLLTEKRNMENVLADSYSVSDLEVKSGTMGYSKPSNLVYISGSEEVAINLP